MFVKGNGYLYASYYCEDARLRYPLGIKADSTRKVDQLLKSRVEAIITKYVTQCQLVGRPIIKSELHLHLDEELGKRMKQKVTFWGDWDQYVADMRSGQVLKKDGGRYSEASAVHYENVRNALRRYESATGKNISYAFTMDAFNHLVSWLVQQDQSRNSIASIVKDLKTFFVRTYKKRHDNPIAKEKSFSYSGEESDTVALSVEEITSLYNLKLTGAKKKARDIMVFACWVALRAEDLSRVNEYHRRGKLIEVLTGKTGEKVVIPLHWMARNIMDEYGEGNLPVYTTAEGLSYHMPELCKMAGITTKHLITITKGGIRQAEYFEKSQLVTAHTARRSFATNMYKAGFPVKSIMKITGHKKEETFFRYIRIDKEQNAEELASSPFFNGPDA